MTAKVGQQAPDFEAEAYQKGKGKLKVRLSDYKGKWVVLFYYPLDFTFVCPTEIRAFAAAEKEFEKEKAVVLGASCDSYASHKNWLERDLKEVDFPMIADKSGKIADEYGIYIPDKGFTLRGTFIIDDKGVLRHSTINDDDVGRDVNETLRTLKAFRTGKLCPANWKEGEKTLN